MAKIVASESNTEKQHLSDLGVPDPCAHEVPAIYKHLSNTYYFIHSNLPFYIYMYIQTFHFILPILPFKFQLYLPTDLNTTLYIHSKCIY